MKLRAQNTIWYITGITVVVFILQQFLSRETLYQLILTPDIFSRPWILVTHMFLHGGIAHILFNMYALIIFGALVLQIIGWKRFLMLYFVSGIVAGFVASFFYPASLGASGAIMGVLAALVVFMPKLKVLFFFAIPMPFWVAGIVWMLLDIGGIFYPSGTGNIAHLVGMAVGFAFALVWKQKKKKFYKGSFSKKTHLDQKDIDNYLSNGNLYN